MTVVSMKDLFGEAGIAGLSPEARAALSTADVIVGVDVATQREFTIFGTPAFEETVQLDSEVAMNTVRVELDEPAGELHKLVALVRAIKARPY
jgi:precorrin-6B methylase 1